MADRTIRTIGAVVVLAGIAIAAFIQVVSTPEDAPAQIVVSDDPGTAVTELAPIDSSTSTTSSEPFVYRVGVLAGISTDNFWAFYGDQPSVWNSYILGPTKPALMSIDAQSQAIENELVKHVDGPVWDGDGWRVRMTLRDDFSWSDGTSITAHDMVFTFDTVRALGLGGSWSEAFPSAVESIHADDDHTLRIEFTSEPQLSVWPHAVGLAPIMPAHIWQSLTVGSSAESLYDIDGSVDVGGGQLTLVAASQSLIVSTANSGYPMSGGPDTVEYHVYPDEATLTSSLVNGEIDSILTPNGVSDEHIATLENEPGVTVVANQGNGVRYLGFNLAREPMSAPEFRTALALLLDRNAMAESIPSIASSAHSFVSEANTSWYDADQAEAIEELYEGSATDRLSAALDGLKAAGYTWEAEPSIVEGGTIKAGTGVRINGRDPQPLTILTPGDAYDPARPEYVASIANTIASLGFDVRPVETDFDTVVDLAFTPDEEDELHYDMYLLGWTLGNPAFPSYYRPLFTPLGELNNTGYSSKKFNSLLATYESAHSFGVARDALWAMETMLAADLPYLVLYHSQITEAYRSDRVTFEVVDSLGGIQARLGGIADVSRNG